ncbi:hypothetical protein Tco_1076583, partial [Tanacetum coccineum]
GAPAAAVAFGSSSPPYSSFSYSSPSVLYFAFRPEKLTYSINKLSITSVNMTSSSPLNLRINLNIRSQNPNDKISVIFWTEVVVGVDTEVVLVAGVVVLVTCRHLRSRYAPPDRTSVARRKNKPSSKSSLVMPMVLEPLETLLAGELKKPKE